MPTLSTPVHIPKAKPSITIGDGIFSMGSCFAERIHSRLAAHSWPVKAAPFGTTYHPIALARQLTHAFSAEQSSFDEAVLERDQLFFHWDASSAFYATSPESLHAKWNEGLFRMREHLQTGKFFLLTLGSAFGYMHQKRGVMVANCHKQPGAAFTKELTTVESMEAALVPALQRVQQRNPSLQLILSVSPVRHIRDGLVENSLSKARLIELSHRVAEQLPNVSYFPAYEIMVDELRDYRYYAEDLIHPSTIAEQMIFERFLSTHFTESAQKFIKDVAAINRDLDHDILYPEAPSTPRFLERLREKIEQFPYPLPLQKEKWEMRWRQYRGMNP
jgi:hypothetical protein